MFYDWLLNSRRVPYCMPEYIDQVVLKKWVIPIPSIGGKSVSFHGVAIFPTKIIVVPASMERMFAFAEFWYRGFKPEELF